MEARSRALRVFAGEGLRRKKPFRKKTALPSQAQDIYNRTWQSEKFLEGIFLPVSSSFSNGSERLESCFTGNPFYAFELNDSSP